MIGFCRSKKHDIFTSFAGALRRNEKRMFLSHPKALPLNQLDILPVESVEGVLPERDFCH